MPSDQPSEDRGEPWAGKVTSGSLAASATRRSAPPLLTAMTGQRRWSALSSWRNVSSVSPDLELAMTSVWGPTQAGSS